MPAVTCPYCFTPATLPDPWPHPGYTCANCRATITFALPPPTSPPPTADPFDVSDAPSRPQRTYHSAPAQAGHGTSAFATMFGGAMGCFFAFVVIGIGIVFLMVKGCQAVDKAIPPDTTPRKSKPDQSAPESSDQITKAKYDSIKTGMTYREVVNIIGQNGEELSRVELGGVTTVMYSWSNPFGSNMNATFQDGKLLSKAQFGLR